MVRLKEEEEDNFIEKNPDRLINFLNKVILYCVRVLAILMTLVIIFAVFNITLELYHSLTAPPFLILSIDSIVVTVGSFLAVLVALEVFLNIIFYLRKDAIHVPLVLATALTAIARKVIVLDFKFISPDYIYATAAVIFAVGISYWLVTKKMGGILEE